MTKHSALLSTKRAYDTGANGDVNQMRNQTAIEIGDLPVLPPKSRVPVTLQIERTVRPPVIPLKIDEIDLELFDE